MFMVRRIEDSAASLHFYNARYLETGIGRFISPDSIVPNPFDPRDHNRYTYVRNNPLKYTDETGHCPWCLGAAIGAVSNMGFQLWEANQSGAKGLAWSSIDWVDVGQSAAIGALTGGVSGFVNSTLTRTGAKMATSFVIGSAGQSANYGIDALRGEPLPSAKKIAIDIALSGVASAGFTGTFLHLGFDTLASGIPVAAIETIATGFASDPDISFFPSATDLNYGWQQESATTYDPTPSLTYSPPKRTYQVSYYSGEDPWR